MRERLIELIINADTYDSYECKLCNKDDDACDCCYAEKLADKLLANGVVCLPCKVGDTVYCIYHEKVIQGTVRLIRPFISEKETVFKGNIICEVDNLFFDDGTKEEVELYVVFEKPYGCERIAYLTREEAERALKGEKV